MSYLISLNPLLLKNVSHVGSLQHFCLFGAGQANGRTDKGVPRGPRGPKKIIAICWQLKIKVLLNHRAEVETKLPPKSECTSPPAKLIRGTSGRGGLVDCEWQNMVEEDMWMAKSEDNVNFSFSQGHDGKSVIFKEPKTINLY